MLILYSIPHSLYCCKTRVLLRAKGLEWQERAPPGGSTSPEYRALFPFGNLPDLIDGDFALSDSEAIAKYIEETRALPALLPQGVQARARVREKSRFHDTRLEPALRGLFPLVAKPDAGAAALAMTAINQRLAQLAVLVAQPQPFSLGDCGYVPTFLWIELLAQALHIEVDWPPTVLAYSARLQSLAFVAEELEQYHPHAVAWIDQKQGRG
jgi:glutathione S-transferase